MTAYVIARITISDRERYAEYEAGFMPIFEKYDGTMLVVDEAPMPWEGDWDATRTVVISFPSVDAAQAWADSEEYREIAKHRHAASVTHAIIARGLDEMAST